MTDSRDVPRLSDPRSGADPTVQALVQTTRDDEPSPGELDRLTRALGPLLGGGSPDGGSGPPPGLGSEPRGGGGAGGPPPPRLAGFGPTLALPRHLAIALAAGLVTIALLGIATRDGDSQPKRETGAAPAPVELASPQSATESPPTPSAATASPLAVAAPSAETPERPRVLPSAAQSAERDDEVELLRRAHASLLEGRADEALALSDRHARAFPRGALSQEREVIRIEALVRLGRRADAAARAATFVERFPHSSHSRRVARLVGGDAGPAPDADAAPP